MLEAYFKPPGISSYDVIRRLKKMHPGERIGHGGTLDPFAEGVLVIGIGRAATKQLGVVLTGTLKEYRATLRLGASSTTGDPEGVISPDDGFKPPVRETIEEVLPRFRGDIEQTPSAYSAIKIQGERAYARARRGEAVDMPSRTVHIERLEIVSYHPPALEIMVQCGSGTYIRSLAQDIGKALGTEAYLTRLVRTRIWKPDDPSVDFKIENAQKV